MTLIIIGAALILSSIAVFKPWFNFCWNRREKQPWLLEHGWLLVEALLASGMILILLGLS